MTMRRRNRRPLARRILRGALLLIAAILLINVAAGYAPFARCLPPVDEAPLRARAEQMKAGVESADRVMILETRAQALDERLRLMAQAQREIVITSYDCRDGESTRDMMAVALERADAGVKVRLLADGIAGRLFMLPNPVFRAMAAHPNVEIRFYNLLKLYTPWRHMGRMHDKYVIADGLAYILGGRNMFDHFIGEFPDARQSRDREALVYNSDGGGASSLYEVRAYFEGMWGHPQTSAFAKGIGDAAREEVYRQLRERLSRLKAEKPDLFAPADYAAMTDATRGVWLISNPTTVYAKRPAAFGQLCALMDTAREEIVIHSPYAVLNGRMRERLAAIAARVPVTLMVNAVENGANVVASGDFMFHRGEVLATGVQLLEYAGGDSYHGKSMAMDDDIAVIGSFNLDLRSAYVDTELMLVINSAAVNAKLRGHMEALHADCRRVRAGGAAEVPEGLDIPPLTAWRRAALYAIGGAMQLVRNLV